MRIVSAICLCLLLFAAACKKDSKLSNIPSITFISALPDELHDGAVKDTCYIIFDFEDGDANINTTGTVPNIFLQDSRTPNDPPAQFAFPPIPDAFKDPAYGFKGSCIIGISGSLLHVRDTTKDDTMHYTITIKDDAGNESNKINTTDIYIRR